MILDILAGGWFVGWFVVCTGRFCYLRGSVSFWFYIDCLSGVLSFRPLGSPCCDFDWTLRKKLEMEEDDACLTTAASRGVCMSLVVSSFFHGCSY